MSFRLGAAALMLTLTASAAMAQVAGVGPVTALGANDQTNQPSPLDDPSKPKTFENSGTKFIPPPQLPKPRPDPIKETYERHVDLARTKIGWGWCSYADTRAKKIYYSSVFPGDPIFDYQQRDIAFKIYLAKTYNVGLNNTDPATCTWAKYDADFVQEDIQGRDQYYWILRNYQVVKADWHP